MTNGIREFVVRHWHLIMPTPVPHPARAAALFIAAYFLVSSVAGPLMMAVAEALWLEPNPNGKSTAWGLFLFGLKATASVGLGYVAGLTFYVANSRGTHHHRTRPVFWPALISAVIALLVSPILGLMGAMSICFAVFLWLGLGFVLGVLTLKW